MCNLRLKNKDYFVYMRCKSIGEYGFMPLVQALFVCRKMPIISLFIVILLIAFFKNNAKTLSVIAAIFTAVTPLNPMSKCKRFFNFPRCSCKCSETIVYYYTDSDNFDMEDICHEQESGNRQSALRQN